MNLQHPYKKVIAKVSLIAFVNLILVVHYPGVVRAGENLSISGFEIKTPAFKPYLNELPVNYRLGNREITASSGEFSFFLNQKALVNAELLDKEFNLIKSLELMKEGKEGENTISWNGRDEQWKFVKSGEYIFSITAMAEDGSSAIISKDVEIEFEAPEETEFKPHITEIEGEPKKEYPERSKVTKTVMEEGYGRTCIMGSIMFPIALAIGWGGGTIGLVLSPVVCTLCEKDGCCGDWVVGSLEGYVIPFSKGVWGFETVQDPEEYAEIKQEIDEYNAELEAEIAEKNREIDEDNLTIVVRIKVVE